MLKKISPAAREGHVFEKICLRRRRGRCSKKNCLRRRRGICSKNFRLRRRRDICSKKFRLRRRKSPKARTQSRTPKYHVFRQKPSNSAKKTIQPKRPNRIHFYHFHFEFYFDFLKKRVGWGTDPPAAGVNRSHFGPNTASCPGGPSNFGIPTSN